MDGLRDVIVQTDEQKEAEIERRAQERVARALADLPPLIERATETAVRRALADGPSIRVSVDWEAGYRELEKHAGENAAQWLGRRLWNILITAAIAGAIAWLVMTGRIK